MDVVTSPTLLHKLKNPDDEEAWKRFYKLYSPVVLGFSRAKGCRPSLANDFLQETMMMLISALPDFDYTPGKGRFRNFLLKIVHRRIMDMYKREKRRQISSSYPNTSPKNIVVSIKLMAVGPLKI